MKVTVPAGVPPPGVTGATVAVNVIDLPPTAGVPEVMSVVEVLAIATSETLLARYSGDSESGPLSAKPETVLNCPLELPTMMGRTCPATGVNPEASVPTRLPASVDLECTVSWPSCVPGVVPPT